MHAGCQEKKEEAYGNGEGPSRGRSAKILGKTDGRDYQGEWRLIEEEGGTQTEGTAEHWSGAAPPIPTPAL